jgi:glycosyltransferase involved in cell wall biosynthesis
MNPLVTCVCLTRNRREWLPKAIDCFLAQTYEPRELLILADGQPVADLVPKSALIRFSQMPERLDIGPKRNAGVAMAYGRVIATWDDDDLSAPGRLEDQVFRLVTSGKSVTGYSSMKFTDGVRTWLYKGTPAVGIGSSLVYLRDWALQHPFPDKNVGEDNGFVAAAMAEGQFIAAPAKDFMVATIHPGNTSVREIEKSPYELITDEAPA